MRPRWIGRHSDWRIAEFLLAGVTAIYGLYLLTGSPTMLDSHHYTYVACLRIPIGLWGGVFLGLGLGRVYAVARKRHWPRHWLALASMALLMALSAMLLIADWHSITGMIGMFGAVMSGLSVLSSADCEVVGGQCNGILEHRVMMLAHRMRERTGTRDG